MDDREEFDQQVQTEIRQMADDGALRAASNEWMHRSVDARYSYHFKWLGLPIIQYPQDIVAMQEIVWDVKPDLIIETGVARGGSLVFYASLLSMLGNGGEVVGIDIEIRPHNREAVESHPLASAIKLLEGSSVDPALLDQIESMCAGKRALVVLDSNHTHEHVIAELEAYSKFVHAGSYLVVFDTVVDWVPPTMYENRPWGREDNPMTAVDQFLGRNDRFEIDRDIDHKLMLSVARGGYLKCTKDP